MGRKCPHHPDTTMAHAAAVGSSPMLVQVAMAMGGEHINRSDGGSCKSSQNAGQDTEYEDQDERIYIVAQYAGNGGAYQVSQTGGAQGIGDTDNTGGHQNDGSADGIADFCEVQNTDHQNYCNGQTGDGITASPMVPCIIIPITAITNTRYVTFCFHLGRSKLSAPEHCWKFLRRKSDDPAGTCTESER